MCFDAVKEHTCIISRDEPEGEAFKILGVVFDTGLYMTEAIKTLSREANWKLRTLLHTKRNFSTEEIINLFKSRILSFIEYRTPAIYHASTTHLEQIDAILDRLLNALGMSAEESLLEHRLAPLCTRRDIGMLGVIHRAVLEEGPSQFAKYFIRKTFSTRPLGREANRRHDKQLMTHRTGKFLDITSHSLLGLVDIYNLLPQYTVNATTVSDFQKRLQKMMMELASNNAPGWKDIYSPRNTLWNNRLRQMQEWSVEKKRFNLAII